MLEYRNIVLRCLLTGPLTESVVALSFEDLHHQHDNALIHKTVFKNRCKAKCIDNSIYRTGRTSKALRKHNIEGNQVEFNEFPSAYLSPHAQLKYMNFH